MFLINMLTRKMKLPTAQEALPGRSEPLLTAETHFVNGNPLKGLIPTILNQRCSALAVSGAQSSFSGKRPASG